eukprot:TRINITY_DN646_c0_g1_i2.p1 TRINITY_DN646_c0_g1~~TRINITY_DN646_c0_g1_i2.p1  ORF type:complete len:106 (-),score=27.05 TRINITY_DN646_c0_g1_i2:437-754(-)
MDRNDDPSEKMKKLLTSKGQDIITNFGKITNKIIVGSNNRSILNNSVYDFIESEKDIEQTNFMIERMLLVMEKLDQKINQSNKEKKEREISKTKKWIEMTILVKR